MTGALYPPFEADFSARRPLRDEVYLVLRRMILQGKLRPGDHLIERELASQLGVSRSPVREALRRLEQERLVTVTRQGVAVQDLDPVEYRELYQLRQDLESLVARLAAHHFSPEHRRALEATLAAQAEAAAANDAERFLACGTRFHQGIAEIAGNRRLARLVDSIVEEINRYRSLMIRLPARGQLALAEHHEILDALAKRDETRAAALMAEHIGRAQAHTDLQSRAPGSQF